VGDDLIHGFFVPKFSWLFLSQVRESCLPLGKQLYDRP